MTATLDLGDVRPPTHEIFGKIVRPVPVQRNSFREWRGLLDIMSPYRHKAKLRYLRGEEVSLRANISAFLFQPHFSGTALKVRPRWPRGVPPEPPSDPFFVRWLPAYSTPGEIVRRR